MDALRQAMELLPWWVTWGAYLIYLPEAILLTFAATLLAGFITGAGGPKPNEPWHQRARRVYPTRMVTIISVIAFPLALSVFATFYAAGLRSRLAEHDFALVVFSACFPAALAGRQIIMRRIWPERSAVGAQLRTLVTSVIVALPHLITVLCAIALMPWDFGIIGVIVIVVAGALILSLGWGTHLKLARAFGLITPAPAQVGQLIEPLAAELDVEIKGIDLLRSATANAFAFPLARRLLVTEKALEVLSDEELHAVMAHEIGHLREPRLVSWTRVGVLLAFVPLALIKPFITWWGPLSIIALFLGIIVVVLAFNVISRRMEKSADAVAAKHQGNPGVYAHALERLYEANLVPVVRGVKNATHPELYDRMVDAGVTPDYPRPKPPAKARRFLAFFASALLIALVLIVPWSVMVAFLDAGEPNRGALYLKMAVTGADARDLHDLGWCDWNDDNLTAAETLFRAAATLDEEEPLYQVDLARVLASAGRCDEARVVIADALERASTLGMSDADSGLEIGRREIGEDCGYLSGGW